jgi:hypothetical protein
VTVGAAPRKQHVSNTIAASAVLLGGVARRRCSVGIRPYHAAMTSLSEYQDLSVAAKKRLEQLKEGL